jgi:hypothetical protein
MWCIIGDSDDQWPEHCRQDFSTPGEARAALATLRALGFLELGVRRDGIDIDEGEFQADIETDDIRRDIEESSVLPAGYRERRRGEPDLGVSRNGTAAVWKPENPEDRFD